LPTSIRKIAAKLRPYIPEPLKGSIGYMTALLFGFGVVMALIGIIDATLRLIHIPKSIAIYLAIVIVLGLVSIAVSRSLRSGKSPESSQSPDNTEDRGEG
jgi:hypothetical protein